MISQASSIGIFVFAGNKTLKTARKQQRINEIGRIHFIAEGRSSNRAYAHLEKIFWNYQGCRDAPFPVGFTDRILDI